MWNLETSLILLAGCLLLVAGQYTKEYEEMFKKPAEECAECMGLDEESARTVYMHKNLTTMSLKCLQYCAYHKKGVMNGTQTASVDYIVPLYKQIHAGDKARIQRANFTVLTCKVRVAMLSSNDDPCKIAGTMQACFGTQK